MVILKTELLYDPANPLKELKAVTPIDTCIPMFMATLFTITKKCIMD